MGELQKFDDLIKYYVDTEKDYSFSKDLDLYDLQSIKTLVKEKRNQYANAPIGQNIFSFIKESEPSIDFLFVSLDRSQIDAMLYITRNKIESAWIIINSKRPFVKQIFAAAHEYYHFIKDYEDVKKKPLICQFNSIQNISEKKANKFAAELLLPTEALNYEVNNFYLTRNYSSKVKKTDFAAWAILVMDLTVKYELPLKAVLYRLFEDGIINNIDNFLTNYDFLKQFFIECKIYQNKTEILFSNNNEFQDDSDTISRMITAYKNGLVSKVRLKDDADKLKINFTNLNDILDDIDSNKEEKNEDNDDDDESLFNCQDQINSKMEE